MLSGCPMAVPNWKLPYIIESSGAIIVGEESCIGTRNTRDLVDESGAYLMTCSTPLWTATCELTAPALCEIPSGWTISSIWPGT